jgi:hypothetical protein
MRSWCTPVYSSSAFIAVLAGQGHRTRRAGPPVVFDATGAAGVTEAMVAMVASAGRAVQVGMSSEQAAIRVGSLTEKELDLLGVSWCGPREFAEAVAVVERNPMAASAAASRSPSGCTCDDPPPRRMLSWQAARTPMPGRLPEHGLRPGRRAGHRAFLRVGGFLPFLTSLTATGPYAIPEVRTGFRVVVTNTTTPGQLRSQETRPASHPLSGGRAHFTRTHQ